MKVILYMAMTVNGIIARDNDDTSFVSNIEWKNFSNTIKKIGNVIIGRRTYEVMLKNNEFKKSNFNKIKIVVLTKNKLIKIHNLKFVFIAKSPYDAIKILQNKGFKTIMVCGGGKLNSTFMKENLIDEIYLDIEPIILGKGIKLFFESDFENKLKLLEIKKLDKNLIQLHYKVLK